MMKLDLVMKNVITDRIMFDNMCKFIIISRKWPSGPAWVVEHRFLQFNGNLMGLDCNKSGVSVGCF